MSKPVSASISDIRQDYRLNELREADAAADPIEQFSRWFANAQRAEIPEPTAMTVATADAAGSPSARIVLLKAFDSAGFCFFTNRLSQKGRDIAENPRAALVFFWKELERQVRITGRVEPLSHEQSVSYFHSRPVTSQVGAWVSKQSTVIANRAELDQKETELIATFSGQIVPMPDYWGGYRVVPNEIEFWQGRPCRLHDRLRYRLAEGKWKIERLAP